jgi:hypothetical protein
MVCLYVREELWVDLTSVQQQTSNCEPVFVGCSVEYICSYSITPMGHTLFSS